MEIHFFEYQPGGGETAFLQISVWHFTSVPCHPSPSVCVTLFYRGFPLPCDFSFLVAVVMGFDRGVFVFV